MKINKKLLLIPFYIIYDLSKQIIELILGTLFIIYILTGFGYMLIIGMATDEYWNNKTVVITFICNTIFLLTIFGIPYIKEIILKYKLNENN